MTSLQDIARSMRDRMPWPVAQKALKELKLPRGRGWENTLERLSRDDPKLEEKSDDAKQALKEHLQCGEKLVRYFSIDRPVRDAIIDRLRDLKIDESTFQKSYPCLLPEDALLPSMSQPILVAVEETEAEISAIFSSIRTTVIREPLVADDLPEEAADILSEYSEIVGVREVRQQAIDVVTVSKQSDFITVRIDYPEGMHRDVGEAAQSQTATRFTAIIGIEGLNAAVNLFPLIDAMYSAPSEGIVVEIAFGTTTASWKHEKMRRRSACLREETYHKAGTLALESPIEPYRLSIVWTRKMSYTESKPELNFHGSSTLAGSGAPALYDVVIRKCIGIDDFSFVESRIQHHLQDIATKAAAA